MCGIRRWCYFRECAHLNGAFVLSKIRRQNRRVYGREKLRAFVCIEVYVLY